MNADGTIGSPQFNRTGSQPGGVIIRDLNRDGKPDIAVANQGSNDVSVFLGTGDGLFQPAAAVSVISANDSQPGPRAVAAGDLDGDGNVDLVTANTSGTVGVLLGRGGRTFRPGASFAVGGSLTAIVVADFNGDGKPDVAVANNPSANRGSSPGNVSVLLGNGDGTLRNPDRYPMANSALSPSALISADFNGDGRPDLAALATNPDGISPGALVILLAQPGGSLQMLPAIPVGTPAGEPTALATGDFNVDGKQDLAVTVLVRQDGGLNYMVVTLLGNGDGTFRAGSITPTDFGPISITATDLNSDGKLDLMIAHCCGVTDATWLLGRGDGTFAAEHKIPGGHNTQAVTAGDLDGDGKPDFVFTDRAPSSNGDFNPAGWMVALKNSFGTVTAAGLRNVSAASFQAIALAPESIATAFGQGLATGTATAQSTPLPTLLSGTSVQIQDAVGGQRLAPLFYVSPPRSITRSRRERQRGMPRLRLFPKTAHRAAPLWGSPRFHRACLCSTPPVWQPRTCCASRQIILNTRKTFTRWTVPEPSLRCRST